MQQVIMKKKVLALILAVAGLLAGARGIATLLHYRSFTEIIEGVMARREGQEVVLRFHVERISPEPRAVHFTGDAEYAFPLDARTEQFQVGDRVTAYYPPGKLSEVRLDRDFSYLLPGVLIGVGLVLVGTAVVLLVFPGRRKPAG
jgi:hypothetical protein